MNRRDAMMLAATGGTAALLAGATRASPSRPSEGGAARGSGFVSTTDGTDLFVRDWGEGRPILFLSGWTLPSDFWAYQMLAMAQRGYRAVSYDRRGHGRSSDPGRNYDHDRLADDLLAVIEARRLDDIVVVAHSMGGTEIARYFARHAGRGISKVMLVGTITPFLMKTSDNPLGVDRHVLAAMRAPLERDFPGWIDANTPPFFVADSSPDMMQWGKSMMLETSLLAAAMLAKANAETDFRPDLPRIQVPTLLIHGDRDVSAALAITAQPSTRLIAGARLKVYPGAPHGLPLTHVEQLNEDVADFSRSG
ncbi:alpha/beta fold hydrolase [Sphingosinicella terrae]|uniref:alpha/beta fold hydrolase n=1 Tax=Sphingosinicella terrae TaxID=2172047 RepID=UPI002548DB0D|nr:alpha/beta hydrolase [Sphingosinicella terrae]